MTKDESDMLRNLHIKVDTLEISLKVMTDSVKKVIEETLISLNSGNDKRLSLLERKVEQLEELSKRCKCGAV